MLKKRLILAILVFSLSAVHLPAQQLKEIPANALKVGEHAPPLKFEQILGGPGATDVNWKALQGKVVVLDFWSTWCPPCVDVIPHMNNLVRRYKGKPIQFISVGHENQPKVEWFLKKYPIEAWVALDIDLDVFESYTAWGIPHAVVVDPQGKVAAVLSPRNLTEAVIDAVLAGRVPEYPKLTPAHYWNPVTAAAHFREVGREAPPKD